MEESRTKNSIRNVKTGALVQIINKFMAFIVRTVFIKTLNAEYLGINGLFTNVLTILSFAELGIGTAIIFNMYKPVAEHNYEKIKSLIFLYKKAYNIIGTTVFVLGLCIIPFFKNIIKDAPNISENLICIYILFLLNTSVSYFFSYKKSIISAHQKQSVIDNIDSVFYFIKSIVEIAILILMKNFIIYLLIEISATVTENLIISITANKMYPYLKDKKVKPLKNKESKNIFDNVKSLIIYKFGGVIMDGTDNILISYMIDVSTVGLCSNYTMIISAIKSIIFAALNGITASVGNLNAIGSQKQKEKIFYEITFINYIIYSFCAIVFMVLLNPFIKIWLGNDYVLELSVSIGLATNFFVYGLRNSGYTYRTTLGLFQKGKIAPYIGAITNIIFSIILCKLFGVAGIFIATSIAQLVSYCWIDPYLIYKYEFKTSLGKYFKRFFEYLITFSVSAIICLTLTNFINKDDIIGFILKGIIVLIVSNFINIIVYCRSNEFKEIKIKLLNSLVKKQNMNE